jgi:beta-galactosidase
MSPILPPARRRDALKLGFAGVAGLGMTGFESPLRAAPADPRRTVLLAEGWSFHLGHASDRARDFDFGRDQRTFAKPGLDVSPATRADFDDAAWTPARVPHDWAVELPFAAPAAAATEAKAADAQAGHGFRAIGRDFPQNSVGWYRLRLPVDRADRGRALWLEFDGVFREAQVFVNGYAAGGSASGYAPFRVDIADFLDYDGGPNQLTLRVDASLGEGWFYEGAGIYRHVRLVSAAPVHVPHWGVCVRSTVAGDAARITVRTGLASVAETGGTVTLAHRVLGPDGRELARTTDQDVTVPALGTAACDAAITLANPALWSPDRPALHLLETTVRRDGAVVDRVTTRFGIRTVTFDTIHGCSINGVPTKLLGVCNHQDHAGVGTALPDGLNRWRVAQMREMGANAWRSAHNPPAPALLDACDEAGMMIIAETRLNSTNPEAFDELDRMILAARNHPSVILWSVGNEEGHEATERGRRISARLVARCKDLDPTRLTTQAMDQGWDSGAAEAVDVVGYNYRTDQIPAWHGRHPGKPVIGTETASTVATRGAYANDPAHHVVRAYDTEHPWWASTAEQWWQVVAGAPYIAGGFIWTGFDYRGEPTPFPAFPSNTSYFGAADLCGFPKDNFYYYRAWWRRDRPLVHLLPHWTWPGRQGQPIEVWVHGNSETVELLLNGTSLGRKAMPQNGHLAWQVPWRPGVLEAVGRTGARIVARDRRVTAGAPARLALTTERSRLAADGADVALIRAEVTDAHGNPVPVADTPLRFAIEGAARLIGLGNGNPVSTEPDKGTARRAFNGLAQAVVQSDGRTGPARLTVSGEGLATAAIDLLFHPEA